MRATSLALALLSLPLPALAHTLTVGPSGSGADFAEIADAVAAAAPGDVICVFAGQYNDFGTIVIDKPLAIPGVHGVVVLALGALFPLPAATLDATGSAALAVAIPPSPSLAGRSLLVQGLAASPNGVLSISAPSSVAIAP
jgi:hypothetical protein